MDEHVPRAVVVGLRLRCVDVLTAQEDGSAELNDAALLRRATELGRTLVSQDYDLLREAGQFHASGVPFAGLIYAHQLRITVGQFVQDLELIARVLTVEQLQGQIQFLPL
jgi:hypothetical protein